MVFNDDYVAGAIYETPYSTERFIYKLGDERAFRDLGGADDPFEKMLPIAASRPNGRGDTRTRSGLIGMDF